MKERKPLMKKESKLKYVILIVFIVLALGYVAYDKLDINLKDIKLFKSKQVIDEDVDTVSNNSLDNTLNLLASNTGGLMILVIAVCSFGVGIVVFILPLFKGMGVGEI